MSYFSLSFFQTHHTYLENRACSVLLTDDLACPMNIMAYRLGAESILQWTIYLDVSIIQISA
jgi:hypothetical protein